MFWKNGIEYRALDPVGGDSTRWDVARVRPQVTISSAADWKLVYVQGAGNGSAQEWNKRLTFADINHECSRNGWHVNPFTGKVLYLEPIVR